MADISAYVQQIQQAARGEEVRDALVNSLNAMNSGIPVTIREALTEAEESGEFVGPQGPKGDKGDTGDTGPKGDAGEAGEPGPQGPQGDKGDTGETGPKGDTGDAGPQGPQGEAGADGVSPSVTITNIAGGHRVTVTDADHPSGQSFDVMDGAGSGDMTGTVYDPDSSVASAGGIAAYVEAYVTEQIGAITDGNEVSY